MKNFKAIIFDFDNTLVNTKEVKGESLKETGKVYYDIEISDETLERYWGLPFEKFMKGVFGDVDTIPKLIENYLTITVNYPLELFPGVNEVVNKLLANFIVGIVTASNRELVVPDLKRLNFPVDEMFIIQTAQDTEFHKPDPKVFSNILTLLKSKNISSSEIIYIGDSWDDYESSKVAGINFLGIDYNNNGLFQNNKIEYVKSFKELEKILL